MYMCVVFASCVRRFCVVCASYVRRVCVMGASSCGLRRRRRRKDIERK